MLALIGGILLLAWAVLLIGGDDAALALIVGPAGGFLLLQGIRRVGRARSTAAHAAGLVSRADEINQRIARGETPAQIAAAFEASYRIPPVRTLQMLAADRLALIGRLQVTDDIVPVMRWTAADRPAIPPTAAAAIAGLSLRSTCFGAAPDVRHDLEDGGKPVHGLLLAARSHLLFLVDPKYESQLAAFVKGFVPSPLPKALGFAKSAAELAEAVGAELRDDFNPSMIADLSARLALPGSFAIPWREVRGVEKESIAGPGPPRLRLVVVHGPEGGDEADVETRRLRSGSGLDEVWVDDWLELMKVVALLDGALLL